MKGHAILFVLCLTLCILDLAALVTLAVTPAVSEAGQLLSPNWPLILCATMLPLSAAASALAGAQLLGRFAGHGAVAGGAVPPASALAAAMLKGNHDMRGALSPALLVADRLSRHSDPETRVQAEEIAAGIEKAVQRLQPALALARQAVPAKD